MKTIDAMRTHIGNLRCQGLMQVAMVDVEKCLDEIERELEEGYVELPTDVNGEHIHIGDKLMGKYLIGNPVVECTRLTLTNGWMVGHGRQDGTADLFVRYKPPTVEDVLREMYDALDDARIPNGSEKRTYEEIIAEYAQKLQLKDDE